MLLRMLLWLVLITLAGCERNSEPIIKEPLWRLMITATDRRTYYLDVNSIRKSGDKLGAWVKAEAANVQDATLAPTAAASSSPWLMFTPDESKSIAIFYEIDCREIAIRVVTMTEWSEPGLQGTRLKEYGADKSFTPVRANTLGAAVIEVACKQAS
jgi:hypothetical protein